MREIKFRAWDKNKNKMYQVRGINFDNEDLWLKINETQIMGANLFEVELMQYTGLKDKNGKEIYKGDILQFYNDVDYIIKPGYAKVVFKDGAFCCKHFRYGTEYLANMDMSDMDITVVGNIYENPELLKEGE